LPITGPREREPAGGIRVERLATLNSLQRSPGLTEVNPTKSIGCARKAGKLLVSNSFCPQGKMTQRRPRLGGLARPWPAAVVWVGVRFSCRAAAPMASLLPEPGQGCCLPFLRGRPRTGLVRGLDGGTRRGG
jgi:hypothetical protein